MARAPPSPAALVRLPGAALAAAGRSVGREWRASALHRLAIGGPCPAGLVVQPRDPRPVDAESGRRIMAGVYRFGLESLDVGPGGDPWRRASPSPRFAAGLHGFGWAADLIAQGEAGTRETLRLWLEWRREFGAFNAFAWSGEALERRVFNLVCAAPAVLALASEAESAALLESLARQARHLLGDTADPGRAAERATVAALAGAALAGKAGEALLERAAARLRLVIPEAVLRDGVHASRAPERSLELLFDLISLDDALAQRGAPSPTEVARAIDRLAAAVRFFAMPDGRLAAFQGGEPGRPDRVAAALKLDAARAKPGKSTPYGAFHRLEGKGLLVLADAGAPPEADWRATACAQPGAVEVFCDGRRLIAGSAWSARASVGGALRGPAGGSCLDLGETWPSASLQHGLLAGGVAEALEAAPLAVKLERQETDEAVWLDVVHDGWRGLGLRATRRLFVEVASGELRGEDALAPIGRGRGRGGVAAAAIRFHLAPQTAAQVAADGKSAVLRPGGRHGWRLRADSAALSLDAGVVFEAGEPRVTQVLRLATRADAVGGVRMRWKLARDAG